jgi:MFS transporter, AAHS family, 4-hydroxybenzoate transporter
MAIVTGGEGTANFIDDRPIGRTQWITILMCALVMFLDGFDTQSISYAVPHIAKEWHLAKAALGPIFSAALVGLMAGYLCLSPLSDRFGHRRVVIFSTAAFAAATLACLLAHDVPTLIAFRFLTGVGLGAATPSAVALTGEYSPARLRASFVLAIYCGFSLGFVISGGVAGWAIPHFGWRSLFWIGALVPLILLPFLLACLPEAFSTLTRPGADRQQALAAFRRIDPHFPENRLPISQMQTANQRAPLRRLFSDGMGAGTLLLWLVFVINLAEFYAVQSWLPTILTDLGYDSGIVVAATSLVTVGGIVAALVVGPAMDRISPYGTLTLLYVAGCIFTGLVGIAFQTSVPLLLGATFLAGLCVSGGQKSVIALGAIFYPSEIRSTGVGWALGIGRLGGIAGPLLVGSAITAGLPARGVFYLLALPMLVMAIAILAMGRRYGGSTSPLARVAA